MSSTATPEVLWAQRSHKTEAEKNIIYLSISVPDVTPTNLKLELKSQTLSFFGHSDSLNRDFQLNLEFYAEIDEAASKISHNPMNIQLVLRKKELREEFWPRLTKDPRKFHNIKTDFSRWVDEDEQEDAPDDNLANMGGMGGMPGMGDMSSMMGDMGSMMGDSGGDFGGVDFSKMGGDEADDDDADETPSLEGEEDKEDSAESISSVTVETSEKDNIEEVS